MIVAIQIEFVSPVRIRGSSNASVYQRVVKPLKGSDRMIESLNENAASNSRGSVEQRQHEYDDADLQRAPGDPARPDRCRGRGARRLRGQRPRGVADDAHPAALTSFQALIQRSKLGGGLAGMMLPKWAGASSLASSTNAAGAILATSSLVIV